MANERYTKFVEALGQAQVPNLLTADVRVIMASAGYVANIAADQYVSSVLPANRVAVSGSLTGKSVTGGVFDADDVTIANVNGADVTQLIYYLHTGDEATSRLLCRYDDFLTSANPSTPPYKPNGAPVTIFHPNDLVKIFPI